ncbi:MAG: TonB-dependent receptor [Terricaulis sp.]|nr:TonB-dependent receptor [Terricaulis sp.]
MRTDQITACASARLTGAKLRQGTSSVLALLAGAPLLLAPLPALAQDGGDVGDIVVTGTRISGFSAPTPVTSLGEAELQVKAASTMSELLDDVPQLRINQNIGKSSEPVGFSTVDLRGLGSQRTLVLVDGRRLGVTDPQGNIDTNIVPVALISNIEIVTGGASAAYGSDAVAGVVNFRLNHRLEGLRADVSYGQTIHDDFERPSLSLAWGGGFLDGRAHVVVAGDYMQNSGQTMQSARDWGANRTALLTNPAYTPTNGQPRLLISDNSTFSLMTPGGVMARAPGLALAQQLGFAPGQGVQFDASGNPIPFNYGTNIGGVFMTGGDGGSFIDDGNLFPELDRLSLYGRVSFDITPNITAFTDIMYSRLDVLSDLTPNYDNGTLTIRADNAYLPTSVQTAMTNASMASFLFGRQIMEDGPSIFDNRTEVLRWTLGLEGSFNGWSWDVSAQIGRNTYESASQNNRIQARWFNSVDAVIDPVSGQAVCRATLANPGANDTTDPYRDIRDCVPVNLFGAGSVSPAARAYYTGTSTYEAEMSQEVFAANVAGEPFSTWAGPVALAFGAEHRREETVQTADVDSELRRWRSINTQGFSGEYEVTEAYAEVVVPIAVDAPFARNLDLNGAIRYTDYSTSGGVTTWKVGVNYTPVDDIRVRGTVSRDIRAPNNYELFSRGNQVINAIIDPRDNIQRQTQQVTSGNPNLNPEEADTQTIGVVYQPGWIPGLRASIDYYQIEINGAISTVSPQNIVDFCHQGQTQFCQGVIRDPVSDLITRVNITPFNADSLETSGIDFELAYSFDAFGGEMTLRGLANQVFELVTSSNGVANDYVGLAGVSAPPQGVPEWRYNLDASYRAGPFTLGASYRYIGGGKFDTRFNRTVLDIADNDIDGIGYVDLSASFALNSSVEFYGRVENLFDEDPPIAP